MSKHYRVLNHREGLLGAFKDLFSRNYRIIKAVDDISMSITRGEIVGFIGPNGAGKSTTIKMLTGVLQPTQGSIIVNGFVPFKQRTACMKKIGVVLGQRTQLWWDIPVIESFTLLKQMYEIPTKTYRDNLALFDSLVHLSELYPVPVRRLSLGQRMLCDIAASFIHDPDIIFLDEPSIGLDIAIKNKVREIIRQLNRLKQTTILITSHDIGDIESLCKRIILIDRGSILYDGSIARFNTIFGSSRTLRVEFIGCPDDGAVEKRLADAFGTAGASGSSGASGILQTQRDNCGWISITIDQDKVHLIDVFSLIMKEFPVKDIKVEEVELEHVIKRVYEGAFSGNGSPLPEPADGAT